MQSPPLQAVLAAAESLQTTLSLAQALAQAGRRIDMTGLEQEVAALCAAAVTLPQSDRESGRAAARTALIELRQGVAALLASLPADAAS